MLAGIHQRWNAISLRTKVTSVTVLLLTLGLLVSGIGTMAMLKPALIGQLDLETPEVLRSKLALVDKVDSEHAEVLIERGDALALTDSLPRNLLELTPSAESAGYYFASAMPATEAGLSQLRQIVKEVTDTENDR